MNTGPPEGGATNAPAPISIPERRPRRWRRRLLVTAAVLIVVALSHALVLGFLGGLLVVNDPLIQAEAVVVMGRCGPYHALPVDELAYLYRKGLAAEILLLEDRSSRLIRAGIIPTLETVLRRELLARGVPETVLTALTFQDASSWDGIRLLRHWLETHPQAQLTMFADEFDSRENAHVVRTVLGPELAGRVHWHALPDQRYNVGDWWHSRPGILAVLSSYVSLVHTYLTGEPEMIEHWDPDQYEQRLQSGKY